MATKSIQVRLDQNLKKRVEAILQQIGIDVPTAVRIFFRRIDVTSGIPFPLQVDPVHSLAPQQVKRIDRKARQAKKGVGTRSFSSMQDLLDDLHV